MKIIFATLMLLFSIVVVVAANADQQTEASPAISTSR